MRLFPSFTHAAKRMAEELTSNSYRVHSGRWQGVDISKRPETEMHEILNWAFQVPLRSLESLDHWREDIRPNLPWADDHFAERVGGQPLNPGEQWKNWPWGNSADKFRAQGGKFDHTYMERFWPKYVKVPNTGDSDINVVKYFMQGIRFEYADLNDLVNHLASDPLSRQAYLPIWFPEDGSPEAKRKPCTLGYWFILRNGFLHMHYPIRSCDIVRHFRDDCYMAVRLMMWMLERLREKDAITWGSVAPGMYSMWIGSLHCFINDIRVLKQWQDDSIVLPKI